MKKWTALLLASLLLLSGCTPVRPAPLETTAPVTTLAPATEPQPETTEPPTEPPTDPPMAQGGSLKVLGEEMETFRPDSTDSRDFVSLSDVSQALGLELTEQDGTVYRDGAPLPGVTALARTDGVFAPVLDLAAALNLESYEDEEQNTTYVYERPGTRDPLPEGIYVPILMYHAVGDDVWGVRELFVSTGDLEDQFRYLTENGYTPIFFSDLSHVTEFDKPVILTFDDGYDDNYREMFPLAQKYGIKVNIAMITDYVGGNHKLTADEIREMWDSGLVSFLSHTGSHPHLSELTEEELASEMERSRLALLRLTGTMPTVLVYPYGDNNELTRQVAARYYDMGVIMTDGYCYVTGDNPYLAARYYVSRDTTLGEFASMVSLAGERQ